MCENCQRRAETNPLRVLDCKEPEDQPIIEGLPSILDHLCEACRSTSQRCGGRWMSEGSSTASRRGLSGGLTTTPERRSKLCTGRSARRTPCWAAAVTTAWRRILGRRSRRRESDFSIGEDRLVLILEEMKPGCGPADH